MIKRIIAYTCVILGIAAVLGFRSGFNNQVILNTLKEDCNCQKITKNDSMHGLTFSRENGTNIGDTYTFTLHNCQFDDFEEYMDEVTAALKSKVKNFCSSEIVILEIKANEVKEKKVVIENCEWTLKSFQKQ